MASSSAFAEQRGIPKMASATDLVSSRSFASPLAQLSLAGGESFASSSSAHFDRPQLVQVKSDPPPLQFNLFRTPSVYSVDSVASLSTISTDERAFHSGDEDDASEYVHGGGDETPESPSTPRGNHYQSDYFAARAAAASPSHRSGSPSTGGPLTPKRSFVVTSRQQTASPSRQPQFTLHPLKANPKAAAIHHREVPEPQQPASPNVPDDLESIHGEQGSEWGDDEQQFEWLDTDRVPEAPNGDGRNASPSKRLGSKLKAAASVVGTHGEGRKLKKNLVFPRRAAPPPPPTAGSAPPYFNRQSSFPPPHDGPPPPRMQNQDQGRSLRGPEEPQTASTMRRPPPLPLKPLLVPMRQGDGPTSANMGRLAPSQGSHMSMQSFAYSFYDIDSPGPSTPRASTPTENRNGTNASAFPHGKYIKVSLSRLEREERERRSSEPSKKGSPTMSEFVDAWTPETMVAKGIEARGQGDLPKSAWFFMKAAEAGSSTGRMYWGLSLRHGWGVAKDDRKAFAELRQACDESLAEGGIDFHQSPGAVKLTLNQKKALTRDLALGMFEIANCFLDGVGAKKAPDVALSYLRFAGNLGDITAQEQLGFLLSKGGNGVKKDMKESAKWYRMAVGQGSTNTFGLAWIWKEKYMK